LDLSTNGGGDSAALCGILALFNNAGANFETNNILDQNRTSEHFACDINLDGVFNSADEEEAKKFASSFKTAVLTSPNSFSCGNLLPSLMKEANYPIIGQRSGGGSCAVAYESTADGLTYYRSSHLCLSNQEGENIDGGVPLNHEIEITKAKMDDEAASLEIPNPKEFYDFTTIAEYMATLD
jgi:C-terminal processing protease CtpA/Prc